MHFGPCSPVVLLIATSGGFPAPSGSSSLVSLWMQCLVGLVLAARCPAAAVHTKRLPNSEINFLFVHFSYCIIPKSCGGMLPSVWLMRGQRSPSTGLYICAA